MSNNKKYVALAVGLTCKPVNPFYADETECRNESGSEYIDRRKKYMDFETNNPTIAITEVMPEGEEFEGSEVWQIRYAQGSMPFKNIPDKAYTNFVSYDEFKRFCDADVNTKETRIAIKPLKPIEPVKCKVCNNNFDSETHILKCNNRDKIAPFDIRPLPTPPTK